MSRKYIKDSSLLVRFIHQSQLLFCRGQGVKASQWLYYLLPPGYITRLAAVAWAGIAPAANSQ